MAQELEKLNKQESLSSEQKERINFRVDELNGSLNTNIELTKDGTGVVADSISGVEKEIEAVKARAMAEVVAAQMKEVYTQAFRNANEIQAMEAEQEELLAKKAAGTITKYVTMLR